MTPALIARRPRLAPAVLALAGVVLAATARAQGTVNVDYLTITPGGGHELRVSVLDAQGNPISGLRRDAFGVEEDGRKVEDLRVVPLDQRYPQWDISVLIDSELLAPSGRGAVKDLLRELGRDAGEHDQLHVAALGGKRHWVEASANNWTEIAERLGDLAGESGGWGTYDWIYGATRRAGRAGDGTARVLLVATKGRDPGSQHAMMDVLALEQARGRPVPVFVILLPSETAGEAERLTRLAVRSGGAPLRVGSPADLAGAAARLKARARGSYLVGFQAVNWNPDTPRHTLLVTVEQGGARAQTTREFATEEALTAPWWKSPQLWLGLVLVLLVAGGGTLVLRRRRLYRLVVRSGEERGCSYEVFASPVTVGAADGNDLTFSEPRVSRNHAVLEASGRKVELVDLNSENGTFVNGDRISRRRLAPGDRISLGGAVELTFDGRG